MKMEKIDCPYLLNGYDNRKQYLEYLSYDFGVPQSIVFALASMLGKDEDFDGLLLALDDASLNYL